MITRIILTLSVLTFVANSAFAEITVQEARNEEYLINHGHSKEMARLINLNRRQTTGQPVKTEKEKFYSWPMRMINRIHAYIDPAIDDGTFGQHEIHSEPSLEDL